MLQLARMCYSVRLSVYQQGQIRRKLGAWFGLSTENDRVRVQRLYRFLARDVIIIYISRLSYDISVRLSVRLSVMEVHWRITANLGFKFRSKFTAHCGRGEG